MKLFSKPICLFLVGATLAASSHAETITFGSGANAFDIEFVEIGNPGNAADTTGTPNPVGSVSYVYNVGKYEISKEMINKANAAGSLGITMADLSGWNGNGANHPATGITWYEAAKFVNYLNTSQSKQAAYNFDGGGNLLVWGAGLYNGSNQFRHKDAYYFLPSIDEWYKAAYGSLNGTWYNFTTGSDTAPTSVSGGTLLNTAVHTASGPAVINNAGGLSAFGTMAQGGNVREWVESASDGVNNTATENRLARGGWWGSGTNALAASFGDVMGPSSDSNITGFRVASVPEPSAVSLLVVGLGGVIALRRRRG